MPTFIKINSNMLIFKKNDGDNIIVRFGSKKSAKKLKKLKKLCKSQNLAKL